MENRKETYNKGNRVPIIEQGTINDDVIRRDITINCLYYNINTKQIEDFQEINYPFDFYIPLSRGNFTLYLVEDYKKIETVLGNGLYLENLLDFDSKIDFQVR